MEQLKLSIDSTAITLATLALQNLKVAAEEAALSIKRLSELAIRLEDGNYPMITQATPETRG